MAELTKDNIKEALGFIADGRRIYGIFEKAESAIAVLGQLNATVESLGKKADILRTEIAGLESREKTLDAEWEKAKSDIALYKNQERTAAGEAAAVYGAALRKKSEEERDVIVSEMADAAVEKADLLDTVCELNVARERLATTIVELKESQTAEQARLDAILANIAELKSRL